MTEPDRPDEGADLAAAYAAAWDEWAATGEADSWDATIGDGLGTTSE